LLEHRPPQAIRERLDVRPEDGLQFDFQRQAVKFVLSLREDFLPHLDTWRTRMPSLLPHRFRLEHLTGAQALEVVQRGGRELVEPDLARDIVDFVSSSQRRRLVRVMEQREVEPALLSVVCDELVDRRILHREEREGVVWLELTHDLLSDPAAQSRTVRVQRRQAEAAAKREAEYAHELRRTRALVAVFAVLLLVAGVALIVA